MSSDRDRLLSLLHQNLYAFTRWCFDELHPGQTYKHAAHIEAMCVALEHVARGECRRLLITVPPRHLKSITTAVAFTAWLLGRDPTKKLLVASYGGDLAAKHARDFRAIVAHPRFGAVFPAFEVSTGRDTRADFETTLRGGRKAVSLGGAVTGFGADIIIVDDLMKATDARSAVMRETAKAYFDETLFSRLNDKENGSIVAIQQRLHEDDIAAYLIEKGGFEHLNLPAVATQRQSHSLYMGRTFSREVGDILAPALESRATLEEIRATIGPAAFSAQYQQDPVPPGGNRIRLEWFGTYDEALPRQDYQFVAQSWDTGMTEEVTSDPSVCLTFGYTGNKWRVLDVWRGRLAYPDLRRKAVDLARSFKADRIIVEEAGTGYPLVQDLRREKLLGDGSRIMTYKPTVDKETRVEVQTAKLESGLITLPAEAPWLGVLKHELKAFPNGRNDDQVDALTQFLEWTSSRRGRGFMRGEKRYPGDPRLTSLRRR
jgi:predicted phage terminase large subunit-like protein